MTDQYGGAAEYCPPVQKVNHLESTDLFNFIYKYTSKINKNNIFI